MKIAITGPNGQLGTRLVNMGCVPLHCDVRSARQIRGSLISTKPDIVVHLAAVTSVDFCEKNYSDCVATNVFGTSAICQISDEIVGPGRVILISTDQVFDGKKGMYNEKDEPNPINAYGLTKVSAEGVVGMYDGKIVRISRSFDSKSYDIAGYLAKLDSGEKIEVPAHFSRSYTHLDFVADMLYQYANRFDEMPKILHLSSATSLSFHEFMCKVAFSYGFPTELVLPRGEVPGHAPRPERTGLDIERALKLGFPAYSVNESIWRMRDE